MTSVFKFPIDFVAQTFATNGVQRAVSRAKTVVVFMEHWMEGLLQDLQLRLLDQTDGDRWDTQRAFAVRRLGDDQTSYQTGRQTPERSCLHNKKLLDNLVYLGQVAQVPVSASQYHANLFIWFNFDGASQQSPDTN